MMVACSRNRANRRGRRSGSRISRSAAVAIPVTTGTPGRTTPAGKTGRTGTPARTGEPRFRRRGHGDGNPLRRDPEDRIGGGIAAGVGTWRGFSPITVRIAFVVAALVTQGWGVPLYFIGWLVIPVRGSTTSIAAKARHDSQGVALAVGLASLLAVFLLLAGVLNDGSIEVYCWPQVVSVACLTLIWRNAPEDEKAGMRHLVEPLESLGGR